MDFITSLSHLVTLDLSTLPHPYSKVELRPYFPHGWYLNKEDVEALCKRIQPKTVVEVGSWMGLSTLHLAECIAKDGKVYAVDTWEGSPNERHDQGVLDILYDQFLSNVIHCGFTEKIIPIRSESVAAAKSLDVQVDLIYLDATHTYEATYTDLCAWYPHVEHCGTLCGDDYTWGDGGVKQAVDQFARERGLSVHTCRNWFWWLEA